MEHINNINSFDNIADYYRDYYYPVILLDKSLNVIYKNASAIAAKLQPRVNIHIKKYLNTENLKILRNISGGKTERQVIELKEYPNRCLALSVDDIIALIFFDSMNYIKNYKTETAKQINKILDKYEEQELCCVDERNNNRMRKIRAYFQRHIANIDTKELESEKNYCNIWEFLNNFAKGVFPFISRLGYKITFDIDEEDKLFIYRLHESDFLTLNFILLSYALSVAVFGNLHIKFTPDTGTGAVIYEFLPVSALKNSGNIDLELAALIARNNNLKLDFQTTEIDINRVEEKAQIWLRFTPSDGVSQAMTANNIINSGIIAERTAIELAFLQANLK